MSATTIDGPVATGVQRRLLAAAILASFVSFLDGSITNIALPAIERDLGGGVAVQQWIVDGYLLTLSALILLAGAVSDRVGRLRILRIALVAFAVTGVLCALAPTAPVLIVARVLQGVAGAFLVPGSLSLIIAVFSGPAQSKAIGRWTGWTSVSALFGPLLGGVLVDALGWRSVFLIGLLPAAASLLALGRIGDGQAVGAAQRIDAPSAVLTAAGLGGLTVGLIELGAGSNATVPVPVATVLLVAGAAALVAFLVRNARTAHPLVPPVLFRARDFAWGNGATLFIYAGLGFATLVPGLYLQEEVGLNPAVAALVSLPGPILLVLLSGRFGALAGKHGPRAFMTVGPLIAALGSAVTMLVRDPATALWFIVPGTILTGLGLSITVAPLTAGILGAVPPALSGVGSAVNNAVARVAGLLAVAATGWVLAGPLSTPGFIRSAGVTAALLVVGAAVSFAGIRGNPDSDAATGVSGAGAAAPSAPGAGPAARPAAAAPTPPPARRRPPRAR